LYLSATQIISYVAKNSVTIGYDFISVALHTD